mgnify:CR=1 FL=1
MGLVDVAAHRAESKEVILLAYRYTPAEFVEGTALSIQSVLDGYSVETSGTLFIVQNNQSLPLTARNSSGRMLRTVRQCMRSAKPGRPKR